MTGWLTQLFIAAAIAAASASGNAPVAQVWPAIRPPASHAAALHALVAQIDREIASLRATEDEPGLQHPAAEADAGASAFSAVHSSGPSPRAVLAQIRRTYAAQAHSLRAQAAQDLASYRSALQGDAERRAADFARAMSVRTQRALAARAQELYEQETTLAYDVARRDAGRRMLLVVKLQDLHLDAQRRAQLRRELAALDAAHDAAVGARRRSDAAILGAYGAKLRADEQAEDARMLADLRAATGAAWEQRRRVYDAQIAGSGANLHFDLPSPAPQTAEPVAPRWHDLANADRASKSATDAEIARLEEERSAVLRELKGPSNPNQSRSD